MFRQRQSVSFMLIVSLLFFLDFFFDDSEVKETLQRAWKKTSCAILRANDEEEEKYEQTICTTAQAKKTRRMGFDLRLDLTNDLEKEKEKRNQADQREKRGKGRRE